MVSYQFAPHNSAGTLRALGLGRYLPQHGYEPVVVCNDYGRAMDWSGAPAHVDDSLPVPAICVSTEWPTRQGSQDRANGMFTT
jgi:hypothetical protein